MTHGDHLKELYGQDYYKRIGSLGGKKAPGEKRTFFTDRDLASRAGKLGKRKKDLHKDNSSV